MKCPNCGETLSQTRTPNGPKICKNGHKYQTSTVLIPVEEKDNIKESNPEIDREFKDAGFIGADDGISE